MLSYGDRLEGEGGLLAGQGELTEEEKRHWQALEMREGACEQAPVAKAGRVAVDAGAVERYAEQKGAICALDRLAARRQLSALQRAWAVVELMRDRRARRKRREDEMVGYMSG